MTQTLNHVINLLKRQREIATKDLAMLPLQKEESLSNPAEFVSKLQRGVLMLPIRQVVAEIPFASLPLEARQYYQRATSDDKTAEMLNSSNSLLSSSSSSNGHHHPHHHMLSPSPGPGGSLDNSHGNGISNGLRSMSPESSDQEVKIVRGRICDSNKPETFNKLWTKEEHEKLVRLLQEYPEEEVAAHRWAKIAKALEHRTPKQVASRVQKHFTKLARMGLPVPGKAPDIKRKKKKTKRRGTKRIRSHHEDIEVVEGPDFVPIKAEKEEEPLSYYKPPPVLMPEDDEDDDETSQTELSQSVMGTRDYQELMELKKLKQMKEKQSASTSNESLVEHLGYKCDGCDIEPIVGIRWSCLDCPEEYEVDLCNACKSNSVRFDTDTHDFKHHRFRKVEVAEAPYYQDDDYASERISANGVDIEHEYLNPSYMPT